MVLPVDNSFYCLWTDLILPVDTFSSFACGQSFYCLWTTFLLPVDNLFIACGLIRMIEIDYLLYIMVLLISTVIQPNTKNFARCARAQKNREEKGKGFLIFVSPDQNLFLGTFEIFGKKPGPQAK